MSPSTRPRPITPASQPPMTPPTTPTSIVGRQPCTEREPTNQPEMLPAMSPTKIQPNSPRSTIRVCHGRSAGEERLAEGEQLVRVAVVCGVAGAFDDREPTVREPRVERCRGLAERYW